MGKMGLYIRDDGVRELAVRLAAAEQITITDAVRRALEEKLGRRREEHGERRRKLREIQERVAALPDLRPGLTDKDLYDEDGLPVL
jgi:antitoxin VapB